MELKDILLRKLDSYLNPKIESKVIIGFLSLGGVLVGFPPIIALFVSFSVKNGNTTFAAEINNGQDITVMLIGLFCLAISAYFYNRKLNKDEKSSEGNDNLLQIKDKKTIVSILNSINTNVIDEAIERGKHSLFYDPVHHYCMSIEGLAKLSTFKIYDTNLNNIFNEFDATFRALTSHGSHLKQTANPDIYRLAKAYEIGNTETHEKYENSYLADVNAFESAYNKLITYTKDNYPDIELDATNKKALENYSSYYNNHG